MNLCHHALEYSRFLHSSKAPGKTGLPLPAGLFAGLPGSNNGFAGHQKAVDEVRRTLFRSKELLKVTDYGAGPGKKMLQQRRIADIAASSSRRKKWSLLHYNLVRHFTPATILELGTSFGFTTALLAMAAPEATVVTLEGCHTTADIAAETFKQLGLTNIRQVTGTFDMTLGPVLEEFQTFDYIFFDGNHRKIPTLNYFLQTLPHKGEKAIFVFDDIRWSEQMNEAWKEICLHPDISLSLDLYSLGILFFDRNLPRQHFYLRY